MIELINFTKVYGDFAGRRSAEPQDRGGRDVRLHRPQRRRQEHDDPLPGHAAQGHAAARGSSTATASRSDPLGVRRSVGYMPDNFGVYDGMKVWEFLDFFAVAYQIPRAQRKQVIGDVLELLDLTHKRDDFVNGLSRGMKQRLCLAKTLVHDPPVLILDEPASGLDPRARIEVKALLKELRRMGKTILISSHILTELADCCTSIGIIERGKLLDARPDRRGLSPHPPQPHRARSRSSRTHGGRPLDHPQHARNARRADRRQPRHRRTGRRRRASWPRLLERLVAAGVGMHSFAEKEPTLEDVFMMVTKGLVA